MAQFCGMVPSPVAKVYRLKEARKRNIQPLRPLLTKPGSLDPRDDEDDDDSGISSHGNGTGSVSLPDLSNTDLTVCLSSASLKNPAYLKAKILWDFKSSRPGTELSVEKGEIVHMLYREGDKVLVLNSSEKRGFIPLRYCSVLQKKIQNPYTSISRPQKQHYNDPHFNKKLLTNMEQAGKNARYINTTNSNSRFGTKVNAKNCNHEQTNVSSSSEEDSDYSFRGTSDYPDMSPKWNRNAPDNFRQRQKLAASYFRKSEETKMLVLYDFIARDENDISVYKGEIILVLNRDDSDWWWIATPEGYEGFVPKVFLSRLSSVSSEGSTSCSIESSSSTSEASSTQAVRFQDPLCTFHRYEKEEWETDSELSRENGYPVDDLDEKETRLPDPDKSRWSTWC